MRKIAVLLLSLATAVCLGLAVACSGGKSLSVGQSNYNAEYGDMFVIPEAVCKGLNPEDVTYRRLYDYLYLRRIYGNGNNHLCGYAGTYRNLR